MSIEQRLAQAVTWIALGAVIVMSWSVWSVSWPLVALVLGLLIGTVVIWLDEQYGMAWYHPIEGVPLTRSTLFMMTVVPLSVYILTSSSSALGMGVILGLLTARAESIVRQTSSPETVQTWLPLARHFPSFSLTALRWLAVSVPWLGVLLTRVGA